MVRCKNTHGHADGRHASAGWTYISTDFTVPGGGDGTPGVNIVWNIAPTAKVVDPEVIFSGTNPTTWRATVPVAGLYSIKQHLSFNNVNAPNGASYLWFAVFQNGNQIAWSNCANPNNNEQFSCNTDAIVSCATGDQFYFVVGQAGPSSDVAMPTSCGGPAGACWLSVTKLSN